MDKAIPVRNNTNPDAIPQSARAFLPLYGGITAIYWILMAVTNYDFLGDSTYYAVSVVNHLSGIDTGASPMWEFGHLAWRPLLLAFYKALGSWIHGPDGPYLTIVAISIALNLVGGYVAVILACALARRFSRDTWRPIFVSTAFACFYALLNYAQTGSSYVIGLACLMLAIWLAVRASEDSLRAPRYLWAAGAALAAAVVLWLPYVIAAGGIALTPILWKTPPKYWRERLRWFAAARILVVAGLLTIGLYGVGAWQAGVRDTAELKQWVTESSHGWQQSKRLLRAGVGVPRSFLYMGDDGTALKQYVLRDPYAHVTAGYLLRVIGWKLAAFYLFAAALLWMLIRSDEPWVLALLTVVAAPLFAFAVLVFESGSPERYVPAFPFLVVALAYALSRWREHRFPSAVVTAFLALVVVMNVSALSVPVIDAHVRQSLNRLTPLVGKTGPGDMVVIIDQYDEIYEFTKNFPFHPINRVSRIPMYQLIRTGNIKASLWREDLAARVLKSWQDGGRVWIPKRLLAERPATQWKWTEGDDPRIRWRDLPAFFHKLNYAGETPGADGFLEIAKTSDNLTIFENFAKRSGN